MQKTIKNKIPDSRFQIQKSGYTLIEILVGLTIVGMLFSIGFVSFRDFSRRQALAGTAKKIQGDLRLAQSLAISGQKPDDIKCNAPNTLDSYGFNVLSNSEYVLEAICTGGTVITKDVSFMSDITLSTPSVNPILFKILARGTNIPEGTSISVILTQSGTNNVTSVTVGSGGEIK